MAALEEYDINVAFKEQALSPQQLLEAEQSSEAANEIDSSRSPVDHSQLIILLESWADIAKQQKVTNFWKDQLSDEHCSFIKEKLLLTRIAISGDIFKRVSVKMIFWWLKCSFRSS